MNDGLRKEMPCKHIARAIVGQFYLCEDNPSCDQKPKTGCHKCGSGDLYPFTAALAPPGSVACWRCGAVRWQP